MMVFNDGVDFLIRFAVRAVTPEDATFDRRDFSQESHQAAIIAAIADDDRRVVVEDYLKRRRPLVWQLFNLFRLAFGIEEQISVNLGNDRPLQVRADESGERFMAAHERI